MLPPALARRLKEAIGLHQRGEAPQAERIYREVIAADAGAADAWHMLAIAQADQGRFGEAAHAVRSATELRPAIPQYWLTRGKIAAELREESEAQASLRRAAELEPRAAEAWFDLAASYEREERLAEAAAAYRAAAERNPGPAAIHYRLATALLRSGQAQAALESYQRAFERDPGFSLDRSECFDFIRGLNFEALPPFWQADMLAFLRRADVDRSRHAPAALGILMAKPSFRAARDGALQAIMHDELFNFLLAEALLGNSVFEAMLTRLRRELLFGEEARAGAPLEFLCNLAQQCLINEFVYDQAEDETPRVATLAAEAESYLRGASVLDDRQLRALAVLAMYRPLDGLRNAQALAAAPGVPPAFAQLVRRAVTEVFEERGLRAAIPSLGPIADEVSRQVRDQYEDNPYPRWLSFDRSPPAPCAAWLAAEVPQVDAARAPAEPAILVAGCGTGREALSIAARVLGAKVTGIDLSLSSLAYARRMANALGLANVELIHSDILEADRLGRQFDVIFASGVLHHMRDPAAGLRALVRRAKPGALLQIQLYGRRPRLDVIAAREVIRSRGLRPGPAEIRAFRREVLAAGPDSPLWRLRRFRDFFSMSECRDLLFHVQEHQYDLPEIVALAEQAGLKVLGVSRDMGRAAMLAYRAMFPEDASRTDPLKWDAVEARDADVARRMFPVWCQAPG